MWCYTAVVLQLRRSPRLNFAVRATNDMLQQAKDMYQLMGKAIDPHALVEILLTLISKQQQQQHWTPLVGSRGGC